ncbi:MAG: hypothetical protein AAFY98_10860, partial [Verrucomicrobiota bacterium]
YFLCACIFLIVLTLPKFISKTHGASMAYVKVLAMAVIPLFSCAIIGADYWLSKLKKGRSKPILFSFWILVCAYSTLVTSGRQPFFFADINQSFREAEEATEKEIALVYPMYGEYQNHVSTTVANYSNRLVPLDSGIFNVDSIRKKTSSIIFMGPKSVPFGQSEPYGSYQLGYPPSRITKLHYESEPSSSWIVEGVNFIALGQFYRDFDSMTVALGRPTNRSQRDLEITYFGQYAGLKQSPRVKVSVDGEEMGSISLENGQNRVQMSPSHQNPDNNSLFHLVTLQWDTSVDLGHAKGVYFIIISVGWNHSE